MSQRKSQACADCTRRKTRCDKVIPCSNCTKRGIAHLCRRAESSGSNDALARYQVGGSSRTGHEFGSFQSGNAEAATNAQILNLVTTLSERVQQLESSLQKTQSSAQDPQVLTSPSQEEAGGVNNTTTGLEIYPVRPSKRARVNQPEPEPVTSGEDSDTVLVETESSGQNDSHAEAEDAATVLEFLAWGRLKDSDLTTTLRSSTVIQEGGILSDKDVIQNAESWGLSPGSMSGAGPLAIESSQLTRIQDVLPTKEQVFQLFEYHSNWLLFMHCAFHAKTFRNELEDFYALDNGIIAVNSSRLQWAALLFSIISSSLCCTRPSQVESWGFSKEEQSMLAKQWYQAAVECLNIARYQQNHNIYSTQAIASMTICAHVLGYSNSQSVLIASAIRIAQSLGFHRLDRSKTVASVNSTLGPLKAEMGRRVWLQLVTQDWFSVPFSETYSVNPLHFTTKRGGHYDDETLEPIATSTPAITSYGSFLYEIASIMPRLQDKVYEAQTLNAKYEQVLHFDQMMRQLVTTQLPQYLSSQVSIDPTWPSWITMARRNLTITSAHKIIMIHRRFLGMSFHDPRFGFTRRTCLAAAKTIINEFKQEQPEESPILWTMQAFAVAAAIILSLDSFNRHQSSHEYEEHRNLVSATIDTLAESASVSSIAARGTRLLTELMMEDYNLRIRNGDTHAIQKGKHRGNENNDASIVGGKSLNVAAFVKKFCESDQPQQAISPVLNSHSSSWLYPDPTSAYRGGQSQMLRTSQADSYGMHASRISPSAPSYEMFGRGSHYPMGPDRYDAFNVPFGQNFIEAFDNFDKRNLAWFDDLLGLAPSNTL